MMTKQPPRHWTIADHARNAPNIPANSDPSILGTLIEREVVPATLAECQVSEAIQERARCNVITLMAGRPQGKKEEVLQMMGLMSV